MQTSQVTIVVSPRERFSYTRQSLESIFQYTELPFELVYVDGNSPTKVGDYLKSKSQEKGFQLIRTDYYLSPNRARNLGLAEVKTKYVVFLDNDVIVSPGWLEALIDCAETTNATVVGPLMCHEEPVHQVVHCAGGETRVIVDATGRRRLREKMYKQGHQVADVRPKMSRSQTELCEFHCMLARTEIFERVGYFDEAFLNTKEHLDFCMGVIQAGGTVYFEPDSVITYVPGPPLEWTDLHFYMLRWSNAWELESLNRLREKWQLAENAYFKQKYKALGWRRRNTILFPIIRRFTLGIRNKFVDKVLMYGIFAPLEKRLNHYLTTSYAKNHLQPQANQVVDFSQEQSQAAVPQI
ncbi:MAG: glycosyltransferase [Methylacidiphilales bacterium]|nr:glycosyltransferase [Candidatus Methylacidiphilales bacterium]